MPCQSQMPCLGPGGPPLHLRHALFTAGLLEALLSHPTMPVKTPNSDVSWNVSHGMVLAMDTNSALNCIHCNDDAFHVPHTLPR